MPELSPNKPTEGAERGVGFSRLVSIQPRPSARGGTGDLMLEANHRVEDTNIALRAITGHKGAGANFLTARLLDSSPYLPNDGYRG